MSGDFSARGLDVCSDRGLNAGGSDMRALILPSIPGWDGCGLSGDFSARGWDVCSDRGLNAGGSDMRALMLPRIGLRPNGRGGSDTDSTVDVRSRDG